ncbi:hypothetical protein PHLGIDRAFT_126295 [Phlebiopsis gigantea 11061_1 CR5-6]|uniref:SMP domain-containing protein n=1 Tax=Phlebiopsis gigantea (strain 11061_1 CR5-6) TaxID=745531 RepID=A0A0C3S2C7_PHLG1|nr:hypothetical protein PHLGIDRAFT_126295 [Phlebiopsis gigantea 11061_1 CR5-6]
MLSANAPSILDTAHPDAAHYAPRIDLKNISDAEARKLMSLEHKALGYRPPPGSLAAEAQAEAAKHPQAGAQISEEAMRLAALADAEKIKQERSKAGVAVGEAEARKALGHRPPPGSLAAQVQAAAARHPQGATSVPAAIRDLQRAALEDAAASGPPSPAVEIDLEFIGEAEARKLMSEEHKALGYRPPPGSLAAAAQAAAAKHPNASTGIEPAKLAKAALKDAKKIETERCSASRSPTTEVSLETIAKDEAGVLHAEEHKATPPAEAQSADETITKEAVSVVQQSEEQSTAESDSMAATVQSVADEIDNDSGTSPGQASV